MSALGGIYYFDNRPVDRSFLLSLGDKLSNHGPDGGSEVISDSIGMVYRAFHTNRESRLEKQPLVSREGHILAWDGRLDNREEMISLLREELNGDRTDVAIAMAAYLRFGSDFLPRLIGDFALSLWEPRTRTLLLARDAVGPRPLYYHANAERIIWSSELMPLLDFAGIKLEVNDEYIAGYLTHGPEPDLTPCKNIYAVHPGHTVIVQNGRLRTQRFWGLDPNHEIRYRTDEEYEEHFRHLFREAVRCRLRVDGAVCINLSGGLDSSAIVCMADEIFGSSDAETSKIETISHVYDEAVSSDERDFIRCVEEKRGRSGYHLSDVDYPPLAIFPDKSPYSFPDYFDCFVDLLRGTCEAMREAGARVLLTGHGGDQMLYSSPIPSPELGDLLIRCRPLHLHCSLKAWSKALKRPYLDLLWRDGVIPLLPTNLQILFSLNQKTKLAPWFDERFIERMNLRERRLGLTDVFGFNLPSGRDQSIGFLSAMRTIAKASYRARGFIEVSHPYVHRPLVEFLQAIPFEQRVRPGETRSLMRRALRDLLPEKILKRKGKKGPEEALFRALAREYNRLQPIFENARVCAHGYMNAEALQAALEKARHGCQKYSFAVLQTISLEFWLRALEHQSPIAKNAAMLDEPSAQLTAALTAAAQAARQPRVHQDTL
jgi:asparagine synthase (glutamine-hydrolysing)